MDKKEYNKHYRQYYKTRKKRVTVPLDLSDYEQLETYANSRDLSTNKLAKEILTNFVHSNENIIINEEQEEMIREFIRVSRGIANNINQIAYNSNIGELIDVNLLLKSLKENEDNFKDIISKISYDNKI
jgi:hypothetical protein